MIQTIFNNSDYIFKNVKLKNSVKDVIDISLVDNCIVKIYTKNTPKTKYITIGKDRIVNGNISIGQSELASIATGQILMSYTLTYHDENFEDETYDSYLEETTDYYLSEGEVATTNPDIDVEDLQNAIVTNQEKIVIVGNKVTELDNKKADKTEIPTNVSQLTNDSNYLTEHQSLDDYALKTEIPTNVSQLTNDSNYLTEHQDISEYALKTEIPTNVSQLTNDSNYLTEHQSLDGYYTKDEIDGKNYLTEHQSLDGYYTKDDVNGLINDVNSFDVCVVESLPTENISQHTIYLVSKNSGTDNDVYDEYIYLGDKFEHIGNTEVDLSEYAKSVDVANAIESLSNSIEENELTSTRAIETITTNYALKTEIPTNVSQLTNDSNYLTEHQDLTNYALKSEIPSDLVIDITQSEYDQLTEYGNCLYNITDGDDANAANYYTKTQIDAMFAELNNI